VIPASIRLDAKRDRGLGIRVHVEQHDGNGNDRWIDLGHRTTSPTEAGHIGAIRGDRVTHEAVVGLWTVSVVAGFRPAFTHEEVHA
jgi:hypothetical protein